MKLAIESKKAIKKRNTKPRIKQIPTKEVESGQSIGEKNTNQMFKRQHGLERMRRRGL